MSEPVRAPPVPPSFLIAIFVVAIAAGIAIAYFGTTGALGAGIP